MELMHYAVPLDHNIKQLVIIPNCYKKNSQISNLSHQDAQPNLTKNDN